MILRPRQTAFVDRAVCLARADDWMNGHESDERAHRTRHWISQPPTEKQMAFLPALVGYTGLTRYAASCYLARRFNRRTIEQICRELDWEPSPEFLSGGP